ncbi:MAG: hypothetical protein WCG03_09320, partial [Kiritimatiellales bacterium]
MKCKAGSRYKGQLVSLILFTAGFPSIVELRAADLDGNLSVTGNVGIGTTAPAGVLQVNSSSTA